VRTHSGRICKYRNDFNLRRRTHAYSVMRGYVLVILNNIILYSSINTNLYDDNARTNSKMLLHGGEINSSNDDLILAVMFWINRVFYSTCEMASHFCDITLYYDVHNCDTLTFE